MTYICVFVRNIRLSAHVEAAVTMQTEHGGETASNCLTSYSRQKRPQVLPAPLPRRMSILPRVRPVSMFWIQPSLQGVIALQFHVSSMSYLWQK